MKTEAEIRKMEKKLRMCRTINPIDKTKIANCDLGRILVNNHQAKALRWVLE